MNLRPLIIGELKADIPVIQGGMGIGISLANLAGAVANEGGVGIISTAQIGYREKDFYENPLKVYQNEEIDAPKPKEVVKKGFFFNLFSKRILK